MIVLRRIAAVFLASVFVLLFLSTLFIYRVNSTAGNPGFYIDQLRQADIYNYLYTDVLPNALDKTELGTSGFNLSWAKPQVVAIARQTAPPEWLRAQTEGAINAVVPYVLGDTPSFSVSIPLKERVQAGASAVKSTLHQDGVITRLYDQAIDTFIGGVPAGLPLPLTAAEIKTTVRTVLPPDWVLKQLDSAVDEVAPYLTKDRENFTIRINLAERQDSLKTALADIMKKPAVYDYIIREFIVKSVTQQVQTVSQFGVTLSGDDIATVVKQALPLDWYQAQVPGVVDQVFGYISGARPTLDITIPIGDRKAAIVDALGRFVAGKMNIPYDSIPALLRNLLTSTIGSALPGQIQLTEAQLVGGSGSSNPFSMARTLMQQGITYTDQDLRNTVGASQLDGIRQWLSGGLTFTEKDFNSLTAGSGFETIRPSIGAFRRSLGAMWVILALLLAAIAFLGGRRWSSRLIWGSAALAAAALVVFIIFGVAFPAVVQPAINAALPSLAGQANVMEAMLAAKGAAIAQSAVSTFAGGLRTQAIILLLVSLGLLVLGIVWHRRQTPAATSGGQPQTSTTPPTG